MMIVAVFHIDDDDDGLVILNDYVDGKLYDKKKYSRNQIIRNEFVLSQFINHTFLYDIHEKSVNVVYNYFYVFASLLELKNFKFDQNLYILNNILYKYYFYDHLVQILPVIHCPINEHISIFDSKLVKRCISLIVEGNDDSIKII